MGRSTIWFAQEENSRSLNVLVEALIEFYNKNDQIPSENEEEYKFSIGELYNEDNHVLGTLLKYSAENKTITYTPQTRKIVEEKTTGNPSGKGRGNTPKKQRLVQHRSHSSKN